LVSGLLITPHYTKVGAFFILSIDYATTVALREAYGIPNQKEREPGETWSALHGIAL
jgi:hypothetical protein